MKLLSSFFLTFFLCTAAYSSHIAGGFISYAPAVNANEYEFTLTIYEDCGGSVSTGDTVILDLNNSCGLGAGPILKLGRVSTEEISQICTSQLQNTACNNGNLHGFEKMIYKGTYTLPGNCDNWILSWRNCNRNASNNLSGGGCFYVEAKLNTTDFPCNSSPIVTSLYQIPYTCAGQTVNLSSYITDIDGDSLNFSFVDALDNQAVPILYSSPYTSSAPIPGVTLSSNGELNFNYSINGYYVITILVEEFDSQGQIKGSMMHDFQIVIENCGNQVPNFTGVSNFNNFGTTASISGDTVSAGVNDQFCFDLSFIDGNSFNSLLIETDIQNILPGAVVTITPGNPVTVNICWNYSPNYVSSNFSVRASDNACPIPGVISKVFFLDLPPSFASIPDSLTICPGKTFISNDLCNEITEPLEWKDSTGNLLSVGTDISCNPCINPEFYFTSSQSISVNLVSNPLNTKNIYIDYFTPLFSFDDSTFTCFNESVQFLGSNSQYSEIWSLMGTSYNQNSFSTTVVDTAALLYEINTETGCYFIDSIILVPTKPNATITGDYNLLTSNTHFQYLWTLNGSFITGTGNQTLVPFTIGDYAVIGTNPYYCSDTSNTITINSTLEQEHHENNYIITRELQHLQINSTEKANEIGSIYIFDLVGRLLIEERVNTASFKLNLPHEHQIYIVKLTGQNGEILAIKKL